MAQRSFTFHWTVNSSGDVTKYEKTYTGTGLIDVEEEIPEAVDYEVQVFIPLVDTHALQITADGPLTLQTNDPDSPDNTIVLSANTPYEQHDDSYDTPKLTTEVRSIFVTNASGGTRLLRIKGIYDAFPGGEQSSSSTSSVSSQSLSISSLSVSSASSLSSQSSSSSSPSMSASSASSLSSSSAGLGAALLLRLQADSGLSTSVDGAAISQWTSTDANLRVFSQATGSKQPLRRNNSLNGLPGVDFDGVDDLLVNATAFLTGASGMVFVVAKMDTTSNILTFISSSDEADNTLFWIMRGSANQIPPKLQICESDGTLQNQANGSTTVGTTAKLYTFVSTGSAYLMRINGVAETTSMGSGSDNGDWLNDVPGRDNTVIGAVKILLGEVQFMNGIIYEIWVTTLLSNADRDEVEARLLLKYGL